MAVQFKRALVLAGLALSGGFAQQAAAQEVHAASTSPLRVSLEYATRQAAQASPELGPAREGQRASERTRRASRQPLTTNPRLELSAGPRWGADQGLDVSVGLWQDVPLAGVGASRERAADARAVAARFMLRSAELQAALTAGLAWVDARTAAELLKIRKESVKSTQRLIKITESRFAEGAATLGERALSRSIHGAAKASVLDAEGMRFSADLELAYAMGADEEKSLLSVGRLDADGPDIKESSAFASLTQSPELRRLAAEAHAARAAASQSQAEGAPSLSLGPSVTREANGDWVLLGRVSIPLPLVNPRAVETAEHEKSAALARAEYARVRRSLRREVHLLVHERAHARRTRDALAKDAVGPAKVAEEEALLKYSLGKSNIQEVNIAQRNLTDAKERWLLAAADARATELKLLAITGRLPGAEFQPARKGAR
ncbi:MAG: TolC family protein [Polyangiaceae bacterium]|nr:TolC family protein [Polyangiaceae bacterium]